MKVLATLRRMTGLNLARSTVEHAVKRRMGALGEPARKAYIDALDEAELRQLVELVVVPESWLFRDPRAFAAAVEHVRARLADGAKVVRILSVPCAGGEEPYSMAMALFDAGVAPQSFIIDALDISAACVARAQAGIYGRNAFRAQDLSFRERYFTPLGDDTYQVDAALQARIRFSQGSILEGPLGSARQYDVIFCRNLLIYFDDPTTAAAIARLSAHLADDGILLAGYAEVPSFVRNGFAPLPHRQAFALRKDHRRSGAPAAPALAPGPARPAPAARPAPTAPSPFTSGASGSRAASGTGRAGGRRPDMAPAAMRPRGTPPIARPEGASTPAAPAMVAAGDQSQLEQARTLADAGKLKEADSACRDFLARHPESADAYFILGLLAENAGQQAAAEAELKRCLYLQPDHYEALCHLALLQEQGGNSSAAATLKARAARAFQKRP